eukprot:Clim_evm25s161 gene=Clim_evmTU25s161
MPGIVKVRVIAARDLPVMDRASDLADTYVECRIGDDSFKTNVCPKTLNPVWNADFRFELDDEEIQNHHLEVKVLDYDTLTADDAVGKVRIDLSSLAPPECPSQLSGWFPIHDTINGLRGELNLNVKLELFLDFNRFRDTSCGVAFFASPRLVPYPGCRLLQVLGMVEELIVNDDPEYQWLDNFRGARSSNEARERLFWNLAGELRRKIGVKVLELGGNAMVGYRQSFDIEGEYGLVARAIGTAVIFDTVVVTRNPALRPGSGNTALESDSGAPKKLTDHTSKDPRRRTASETRRDDTSSERDYEEDYEDDEEEIDDVPQRKSTKVSFNAQTEKGGPGSPERSISPVTSGYIENESAVPSTAPSQSSSSAAAAHNMPAPTSSGISGIRNAIRLRAQDINILTVRNVPSILLKSLGGIVSAVSIKVLYHMKDAEEEDARDAWWAELREEIRSHCRTLGHRAVIAYTESITICGELEILYAQGTAVTLDLTHPALMALDPQAPEAAVNEIVNAQRQAYSESNGDDPEDQRPNDNSTTRTSAGDHLVTEAGLIVGGSYRTNTRRRWPSGAHPEDDPPTTALNVRNRLNMRAKRRLACSLCHINFANQVSNLPMHLVKCACCRKKYVPDVLLCTSDVPVGLPLTGEGFLLEARVCRARKKQNSSSANAVAVSETLPFLQYDLHSQLLNKLRIHGVNAIFNLRINISVGANLIVGHASGTASYVSALPQPPLISILRSLEIIDEEDRKLVGMQKKIAELSLESRRRMDQALQEERALVQDKSDAKRGFKIRSDDFGSFRQTDEGEDSATSSSVSSSDEEDDDLVINAIGGRNKTSFVMEVDDETDEDSMAALLDPVHPQWITFCTSENVPGDPTYRNAASSSGVRVLQSIVAMKRVTIRNDGPLSQQLSHIFHGLHASMVSRVAIFQPCSVARCEYDIQIPDEDVVQIIMHCNVVKRPMKTHRISVDSEDSDGDETADIKTPFLDTPTVKLTSLSGIPGATIERNVGFVNIFVIKENMALREQGGAANFMYHFLLEAKAMARAHVASLGGNALIGMTIGQLKLLDSSHRNTAYVLINLTGDAVIADLPDQ